MEGAERLIAGVFAMAQPYPALPISLLPVSQGRLCLAGGGYLHMAIIPSLCIKASQEVT